MKRFLALALTTLVVTNCFGADLTGHCDMDRHEKEFEEADKLIQIIIDNINSGNKNVDVISWAEFEIAYEKLYGTEPEYSDYLSYFSKSVAKNNY